MINQGNGCVSSDSAPDCPGDDDMETSLLELDEVQMEINSLHDKEKDEIRTLKKKYRNLCQPLYEKRTDLIENIPMFWLSIFLEHPKISESLTYRDRLALQYLTNIVVDEFDEDDYGSKGDTGYRISFYFAKNNYFCNKVLTKECRSTGTGDPVCCMSEIKWLSGRSLIYKALPFCTLRTDENVAPPSSFFSWFRESSVDRIDSLDKLIKEQLWPNPLLPKCQVSETELLEYLANDDPLRETEFMNSAVCFLMSRKIFRRTGPPCAACDKPMYLRARKETKDGMEFICPMHRNKASVRSDSYLHHSSLRADLFVCLAYFWAFRFTIAETIKVVKLSVTAVEVWFSRLRDVCMWYLNVYPRILGGPGRIVELDLKLLTTRKMRKGRFLPQKWILYGTDRSTKLGFLVAVLDRSRQTLAPMIEKFIAPGSVIYTDKRTPFNFLRRMSKTPPFVWKVIKKDKAKSVVLPFAAKMWKDWYLWFLGPRSTSKRYFYDFMWRQEFGQTNEDAFDNILRHISVWYPTS